MMSPETYSPTQAAKRAGINDKTLRSWGPIYAEFLSAGANPGPGQNRRYTLADVDLFRTIDNLRHNGLDHAQVIDRLRINPTETSQTVTASPGPSSSTSLVSTATPASTEAVTAFLVTADSRLHDVTSRIDAIDKRLASAEHTRNLILAFAAGAVFVGIIAILIIWILLLR